MHEDFVVIGYFFVLIICFFFFKQKTAYEMRISDWSSDVCSSDLLEARGIPAVLVTVAATDGSAPREAGTKMVVTETDSFATIGGGTLEFRAIEIARQMLAGRQGPSLRKFPLGPALGQCCGGHVTLLFEPQRTDLFTVALFGAGHEIGREHVRTP